MAKTVGKISAMTTLNAEYATSAGRTAKARNGIGGKRESGA